MFTWAADFLIRPSARMNSRGNRRRLIWKFRSRALGLGAVVGVGRNLHLSHRVAFDPGRGQVKGLHCFRGTRSHGRRRREAPPDHRIRTIGPS